MSASFALYGEVETRNESTKQKNGKGFNLIYKFPYINPSFGRVSI